ncbi:hypothetical protein V6X73_09265 [Spiribacter sp. 390]|uniref:Uncharacterized protein n=1 Tax=Spiribacter pallidus TaxID=1987936 RepID=A0ABV3TG96_9GAMM
MAKFDYIKTKSTADNLLDKFGVTRTFTRETNTGFDPSTGTTTNTTETFTAAVVWLSFNKDEIDGSLIQEGDARLLISGEVKVGDEVDREGSTWRIVNTNPLYPADTLVYTEAQARQ